MLLNIFLLPLQVHQFLGGMEMFSSAHKHDMTCSGARWLQDVKSSSVDNELDVCSDMF